MLNVLDLYGNTDPLDTETNYKDDTNAIEFKDLKASIFNIEHETSAVYMQSTRTQEALNIESTKPRIIRPHPETSIDDKLNNIEARLKKMETAKEEAEQREYAQKTRRLISELKSNLLDIEAKHRDDIETCELDALRAALDYATFNTNMIYMSHQKDELHI